MRCASGVGFRASFSARLWWYTSIGRFSTYSSSSSSEAASPTLAARERERDACDRGRAGDAALDSPSTPASSCAPLEPSSPGSFSSSEAWAVQSGVSRAAVSTGAGVCARHVPASWRSHVSLPKWPTSVPSSLQSETWASADELRRLFVRAMYSIEEMACVCACQCTSSSGGVADPRIAHDFMYPALSAVHRRLSSLVAHRATMDSPRLWPAENSISILPSSVSHSRTIPSAPADTK
mmetsp:Transcript_23694/g.77042  ORF Transcript_23694/g.77042 Transcript_23694/m.77042 type:complete len:237 (-) Transcript_23694:1272-1982(-)